MQGFRTLIGNGAAFAGLPDAISALYSAFPALAGVMPETKAAVLLVVGMNIWLRLKTTTPVGQSDSGKMFAESQVRFLLALIRREIARSKETPK